MKPMIILVAGGSASGKTTVVSEIIESSGIDEVLIITQDDYYNDQKDMSMEERYDVNYDHPNSIDVNLLESHLKELIKDNSIKKPIYDFNNYTRSERVEELTPKKVIIVEGILILENEKIRDLADLKIFVELDDDTRFIRRLKRDMKERNRSVDSVINQYEKTVKPMYHRFIKPTKRYADIIILNDYKHDVAVDVIVAKIKQILGENR